MSLAHYQRDQQQRIEMHLTHLGGLVTATERARDLAPTPVDRARYEEQLGTLKADIERYSAELQQLEEEMNAGAASRTRKPARNPAYRIDLDDSLSDDEQQRLFRNEVQAIAAILDYDIEGLTLPESADVPIFVGVKPGDFKVMRCLFGTTCKVVGDAEVTAFRALLDLNRARLDLRDAILVTNTYIAPSARQIAGQSGIQILTFEELLDKVFQLTPYLKKHLKDYEEKDPLFHTYVDVRYLRRGKGEYPDAQATGEETLVTSNQGIVTFSDGVTHEISIFEAKGELTPYIDAWVRAGGGGQVCVLGDYGTGKTSFAKHYFWHAANAYLQDPVRHRIPLFVPLSRYHTSTDVEQMMTGFLVNECNTRRTFDSFLRLAELGKFLVILDGFDEMAKQVDLNVRRRNFRELAKLTIGRNKVILSGRPNYFLTQDEIDQVFTTGAGAGDPYRRALQSAAKPLPRYDVLRLTLFDRWQIEEFLKNQSEFLKACGIDDWRELRQTIARTYNLEELARTPVLLDIIIKTLSQLRTQVSEINAAKLYGIYTDHWLDEEYGKGEMRWLITRADKELFMLDLAWSMLTTDGRPEIHFSQLSRRVQQHFKLDRSTEIDYFSSDIRFCSYLGHSETDGMYRFIHKSFMEYFCARHIMQRVMNEGLVPTVATAKTLPEEVFFFLCQLAGDEGVEKLMALARAQMDDATKAFVVRLGTRMLQHFIEKDRERGDMAKVEQRVRRLLDQSSEFGDRRGYLSGLMTSGWQFMEVGRLAEAEPLYEKALEIAQQLDDQPSLRRLMLQFGEIDEGRGEIERALRRYENVLEMLERDDDPVDRWATLIAMGRMHARTGNASHALALLEQAALLVELAEDRVALAKTLELIAETYERLGDNVGALNHSRRAVALHREIGDSRRIGVALMGIADIHQRMGNLPDALGDAEGALALFQEVASLNDQASTELFLARIHIIQHDVNAAQARLRNAIRHSRVVGNRRFDAEASLLLGDVYRRTDRGEEALELQKRALETFELLGDPTNVCFSLIAISHTAAGLQRLDEARTTFERAVSALGHVIDPRFFIEAGADLGSLSVRQDWLDDARRMYNAVLEMARRYSLFTDETRMLEALGDVETKAGHAMAADKFYDDAAKHFEGLRAERRVAEISLKRAALARKRKDWKGFVKFYRRYRLFAEAQGLPLSGELEEEYRRLDADRVAESAFDLGTVVQTPDRFWGRQTELDTVISHVMDGHNVAIAGDRRIGKTSLLYRVASQIQRPLVPVWVNLQAFPAQAEVLLEGILRDVVTNLVERELIAPDARSRASVSYASDFSRALRSIMEEAGEKMRVRLVLILDEADVLLTAGAGSAIREAFMDTTLAMAILSMSEAATRESRTDSRQQSPMLNIFNLVVLGPLPEEELKDGLRAALTRMGITIHEDALLLAYAWSGGMPWIAQSIGHHAAIRAGQESRSAIGVEDLESIRSRVAEQTTIMFQSVFEGASDGERQLLRGVVNGQLSWYGNPNFYPLIRRGILADDPPRLTSQLFDDWIRTHAMASFDKSS
jgi:tetratricopeptide (TPR) repeat protein